MKLDKALIFVAIILAAFVGLAVGIITSGLIVGVDADSGTRLITMGASLVLAFSALLLIDILIVTRRRSHRA